MKRVPQNVVVYLHKRCAKFKNLLDIEINHPSATKWAESSISSMETPNLGNHYSQLGNRIVTEKGRYHKFGAWGGSSMTAIKDIGVQEANDMLNYAVMTKSPNHICSIEDLFQSFSTSWKIEFYMSETARREEDLLNNQPRHSLTQSNIDFDF